MNITKALLTDLVDSEVNRRSKDFIAYLSMQSKKSKINSESQETKYLCDNPACHSHCPVHLRPEIPGSSKLVPAFVNGFGAELTTEQKQFFSFSKKTNYCAACRPFKLSTIKHARMNPRERKHKK